MTLEIKGTKDAQTVLDILKKNGYYVLCYQEAFTESEKFLMTVNNKNDIWFNKLSMFGKE